jgi:hypothetical protein
MAGLMLKNIREQSHGLDQTECTDTQIFEHSYKECGRADLKEAF